METNPSSEEKPKNELEKQESQEQPVAGFEEKKAFTESLMNIVLARGYEFKSENEKEKVFEKDGQTLRLIYNFNSSGYISGLAKFEYEGVKPCTMTFGHQEELNDAGVEKTFDAVLEKYEKRNEQNEGEAPLVKESTGERLSPKERELHAVQQEVDSAKKHLEEGTLLGETLDGLYQTGERAYQLYADDLCQEIRDLMDTIEAKIYEDRAKKVESLGYAVIRNDTKIMEVQKDGYDIMMEVYALPSKHGFEGGKISTMYMHNSEGLGFNPKDEDNEKQSMTTEQEEAFLKIVQELVSVLN